MYKARMLAYILMTYLAPTIARAENLYFPIHGNVTVGELKPIEFITEPNARLEESLLDFFSNEGYTFEPGWSNHDVKYSYGLLDINGDGQREAIVYILHPMGAGSGGHHIWIFRDDGMNFELTARFLHTWALVIEEPQSTLESSIILVWGKINMFPEDYFYRRCIFNDINDFTRANEEHLPCNVIADDSFISGHVIVSPESEGAHVHTLYESNPTALEPQVCSNQGIPASSQTKFETILDLGIYIEIPENHKLVALERDSYLVFDENDLYIMDCLAQGGTLDSRGTTILSIRKFSQLGTQGLSSVIASQRPSSPFFQGQISQHSDNVLNALIIEAPSGKAVGAWFEVPLNESVVMIELSCSDCQLDATHAVQVLNTIWTIP